MKRLGRRRALAVSAFGAAFVVLLLGQSAQGASRAASLNRGQQELVARGYLVRDPAALSAAKAAAARAAKGSAAGPKASSVLKGWDGVSDPNVSPSDSTGAVGTTRYVETINDQYGIYDRTGGGTPSTLETGTLKALTGDSSDFLTDPQVVWDPATSRFYYTVLDFGNDHLEMGWSTTASPSGAADFCKYDMDFGYGTNIPDYPKLGTTADFLLVGVNTFDGNTSAYISSDVVWMAKPPAGSTCPSQTTVNAYKKGVVANLKNAGGSTQAFTPVPAVQTDSSSTGWIVSVTDQLSDTKLSLFQVTKDGSGNAVVASTGTNVTVASYSPPANAPAGTGSSNTLDTLDNRLTQAVSGFDPARGKTAIWTQHAIAGGAGSEERWYEIDAAGHTVLQSGDITDSSLYVFNGATSPDRVVNGANTAFGSNMATVFTTSSSSSYPSIQAVTKTAWDAQSGFIPLKTGTAAENDFTCVSPYGPPCRWGDYSGARPDPAADRSAPQGVVWFTNMYSVAGSNPSDVDWRTWNGAIQVAQSYGYLRVVTSPALPSEISVDGQPADSWGLTWVKVPTGSHTVSFSDVDGYATPAPQTVTVNEGATTTVTGTFTALGLQRVLTSPALAGTISVDGTPRNDWGMWTWLPTGSHQVCFGLVQDYDVPGCQTINVVAGSGTNTDVTGTYVAHSGQPAPTGFGYLRVVTSPAVPSQIKVNGTAYDSWGLTWVKVAPGNYTVSFSDVDGYTTPAPQSVSVSNGGTTTVTGTFVARGLLRVLTSPAVSGTVYIDGVPRNDWGVWSWFPTGSHTICFGWAAGYNQPTCQTINLTTSGATVTGTYTAVP